MKYLITSALPYINGVKHLGNLAGSMLPADVYARFLRMQGHEVLFICATDEHGTPAELAAAEQHMDVQAYCDQQHILQRKIYADFHLSFDWFGRTSLILNHRLTQHFCHKLESRGLIEERVVKQVYSLDDGRFLPDRYVEGTCPLCGYENARGDQCDACGELLDSTELICPRSKISGSRHIEIRETSHLFLLQSQMVEQVTHWVDSANQWGELARSIAYKWIGEGFKDRAITRDLDWGIPVNSEGENQPSLKNKVFYVWFDAPIGYISATQDWAENTGNDWQRWWRLDHGAADVKYVQFMGKDNVAFHAVSFPITILGSGEPWKLVDQIKAFNWLNWYGEKFSTSQKRGVFMDKALSLLPVDFWRWYLLVNAPERSDFSFTWDSFQRTCNADLANNLGNFVSRITRFCEAKFDGIVPEGGELAAVEYSLCCALDERLSALTAFHEQIEIRKAALETRRIWDLGNEYISKAEPWTVLKSDPIRAATVTRIGLNLCVIFAELAYPFIPDTAGKILSAFGVETSEVRWPNRPATALLNRLPVGTLVERPPMLFHKIDDAWIAEQVKIYSGPEHSSDAVQFARGSSPSLSLGG